MAEMKEQNKSPEKELNKIETSNLRVAEFKTRVVRMLSELTENLSSMKRIQSEMKDTLIEITIYRESTVEWMNLRIKQPLGT